jgi:hypothetical protein
MYAKQLDVCGIMILLKERYSSNGKLFGERISSGGVRTGEYSFTGVVGSSLVDATSTHCFEVEARS